MTPALVYPMTVSTYVMVNDFFLATVADMGKIDKDNEEQTKNNINIKILFDYIDLAKQMEAMGVKTIIYTDISKDGTLSGPNVEQLVELNNAVSCDITASGGVTNIDDIVALRDKNLYGAICGKSIYKGTLDLKQAVEVCK